MNGPNPPILQKILSDPKAREQFKSLKPSEMDGAEIEMNDGSTVVISRPQSYYEYSKRPKQ